MRRFGLLLLVLGILMTPSCGKRRKVCYPVSGQVLVNGKPAKDLIVVFNPKVVEEERVAPSAQTDKDGRFKLSTFASDDGAPEGEYSVTFSWRTPSGLLKDQFDGPDQLGGRYNDPKKNLHLVTIEKKPTELPPFNLTK